MGEREIYRCNYHRPIVDTKGSHHPAADVAAQHDRDGGQGHEDGRDRLHAHFPCVFVRHVSEK